MFVRFIRLEAIVVWTSLSMWRSYFTPSFPPKCWLSKFSMWDGQFHYDLWVPSSGLISTTKVKSVKKSIDLYNVSFLFTYFSPSNLYILNTKAVAYHSVKSNTMFILVNGVFSVPFTNTSLHIRISVRFEILWNTNHLFGILRRDYSYSFWQGDC